MTMTYSGVRFLVLGAGMLVLSGCGSTVSEGNHGLQSDGSFNLISL
ncbi:MAG: hypothetical protein HKN05_05030 [Rhizobiales bacterium]|nr:hypothetical protein [Hyphomicrobiales bacterium]